MAPDVQATSGAPGAPGRIGPGATGIRPTVVISVRRDTRLGPDWEYERSHRHDRAESRSRSSSGDRPSGRHGAGCPATNAGDSCSARPVSLRRPRLSRSRHGRNRQIAQASANRFSTNAANQLKLYLAVLQQHVDNLVSGCVKRYEPPPTTGSGCARPSGLLRFHQATARILLIFENDNVTEPRSRPR